MARVFTLNEGIQHIEDLSIEKFLHAVDNLSTLEAGEKCDGAELAFGLDADGKFYTSRNMKGGKGIHYSSSDYLKGGGGPTFAAAHDALEKVIDIIKRVMKPMEAVEIEVIFGRQPNAIIYGLNDLNYITFLRAVDEYDDAPIRKDLPTKLAAALSDKKITISSSFPMSTDGMKITSETVSSSWKFISVPKIDAKTIETDAVKDQIKKLRNFLAEPNIPARDAGLDLSNFEIATVKLTNIPMDMRDVIKHEREQVNVTILTEFKLKIKEILLKTVSSKIKSKLQGDVNQGEVGGIEGIVFVDPESNEVFKLVDKDNFTAINKFNYQVRKRLFSVIRSTDPDASLEVRGGLVGVLKFRIMSLLGIPEATRGFNLKRLLSDLDGDSADDTVAKFAAGYSKINANVYRQKISAMITSSLSALTDELKDFKDNHAKFKLQLKNGTNVGYTDEIVRRTLLTFAEVREYLETYKAAVDKTRTMEELLYSIVGHMVNKLFDNETDQLHESINARHVERLEHFKHESASTLIHTYMYNYLSAILLCKLKNKKGMHELRDPKGSSIKRLGNSYINQLGSILFNSENFPDYVNKRESTKLQKITQKVATDRKKKIHQQISSSHNYALDYDLIISNVNLLDHHFDLNDKLLHSAVKILKHWRTSTIDEKSALLNKTFYKLQAVDEKSPYVNLLGKAIEQFLMKLNEENGMLIQEISRLVEDGESGDGVAPAQVANPALATMTQSADVATVPFRLFKGKIIRRIPRTIKKRKKFAKTKMIITANK